MKQAIRDHIFDSDRVRLSQQYHQYRASFSELLAGTGILFVKAKVKEVTLENKVPLCE